MYSSDLPPKRNSRFFAGLPESVLNRGKQMIALIIQLISGAVGGNIAGALMQKFSLGPIGNSIAGIVGGGIGGHLLSMVMSSGAASSAASAVSGSGLDMSSILSSVGGGGVGGAVVMAIVGLIKTQMSKS
jgi:uncharacterized membrane protein YeaQ/YmgE (transglycosylase-associated protein family)